MQGQYDRTVSLIGEAAFKRLSAAHVLVVGLGGVGGAATEVLARSGVTHLTLVDGDAFEPTNLNRQLLCTQTDIGKNKASVAAERAAEINPDIKVTAVPEFFGEKTAERLFAAHYDYCIDAIDDLKNKLLLIETCIEREIPIVSAMGAGNRLSCDFCATDIYKTSGDPFARKLRRELKKRGVERLDVVCAASPPILRLGVPASIAAPPIVMGSMLAQLAISRLIETGEPENKDDQSRR